MPSVASTLAELGGCGTWGELRRVHRRRALQKAVASHEIVRVARGRYVLAVVDAHRREAHARTSTLSHLSAALCHGWKVKTTPDRPWLTVPRHRKVTRAARASAHVHHAELDRCEVAEGVTTPLRTVLDCARVLPFDEALAVADSALRAGDVGREELVRAAAELRGSGAARARRVAAHADARAANPLESVLRAIVIDVPGVEVVPQHVVAEPGVFAVVDLADPRLRLALEAEGFAYHGGREDWRNDCRRFTELAAARWWVLRFTYEDVMHHPERVRAAITAWLAASPPPAHGLLVA